MKNKQNNGFIKNPFLYILIIVVLVTGFQYFFTGSATGRSQQINYSQLVKEIQNNNVTEMSYQPNGSIIEVSGTYKKPKESKDTTGILFFSPEISKVSRFTSVVLPSDTTVSDLQKLAAEHETEVTIKRESSSGMWINLLISLVPFIIIAFIFMSMMNQGGGGARGAMNFGRNKARAANKEDIKVRFSDVAGAEEEKQELDEIEKARQALQYGLESEILEVVNKVDKKDFETLQGDFNRLFTETKSPAVREGLFGLYQKYEDAQLTEAAVAVLEDYEAQQRTLIKAALSYLAAVKPELTLALNEALQNILTQNTAEYGAETVSVLGEIGSDETASFLAGYFDSLTIDDAKQELILKQTIMVALEKLHSEDTREFLLERAQDENENIYVRSSAIAGLAQMGNPDIVPLLAAFFEQPEPQLREAAIRGAASFDTDETSRKR